MSLLPVAGTEVSIDVPESKETNAIYAKWLSERLKVPPNFNAHYMAGWKGGKVVFVIGFFNFAHGRVEMAVACDDPRAVSRGAILVALAHAYLPPWSCTAITAATEKRNEKARKWLKFMGFREEGRLRKASPRGSHLMLHSLLREEFAELVKKFRSEEIAKQFLAGIRHDG